MDEIEHRLHARRATIIETLADGSMRLRFATMDQGRTAELSLQQELATIEQTLTQMEATKAQQDETARRRDEDHARDDATFWLRRFMVSLQIGNGAAFLAVLAMLTQHDDWAAAAKVLSGPAWLFGLGLLTAGAVPFAMWFDRRYQATTGDRAGPWLAGFAAACFAGGIFGALLTVENLARHPPRAASSAPQTPAPPPTAAPAATPAPSAPPSPPKAPDQRPASGSHG